MPIKTIFLDRDGVINKEKNYLYQKDDFEFIHGVFDACQYLSNLNYKIIIVTNQSGISRGHFTESDFQYLNDWMIKKFSSNKINILDTFYCPHSPEDNCQCRKPMPGMLLQAQKKFSIDMSNSWLIGDKEDDIKAANNAGIMNTILVKSGHNVDEFNSNAKFVLDSIKNIHQAIKN
jgi:D-glycero-D-manno-heptose 1,7-bisphosphate phosphatase